MIDVTKTMSCSLWLLIHLGRRPGETVSTREVAREHRLSPTYLAKVAKILKRAGLVESQRGVGGGVRLSRPVDRISLTEVVQAIQGPASVPTCQIRHEDCPQICSCPVKTFSTLVNTQILQFLGGVTVSDLMEADARGLRPADGATFLRGRAIRALRPERRFPGGERRAASGRRS